MAKAKARANTRRTVDDFSLGGNQPRAVVVRERPMTDGQSRARKRVPVELAREPSNAAVALALGRDDELLLDLRAIRSDALVEVQVGVTVIARREPNGEGRDGDELLVSWSALRGLGASFSLVVFVTEPRVEHGRSLAIAGLPTRHATIECVRRDWLTVLTAKRSVGVALGLLAAVTAFFVAARDSAVAFPSSAGRSLPLSQVQRLGLGHVAVCADGACSVLSERWTQRAGVAIARPECPAPCRATIAPIAARVQMRSYDEESLSMLAREWTTQSVFTSFAMSVEVAIAMGPLTVMADTESAREQAMEQRFLIPTGPETRVTSVDDRRVRRCGREDQLVVAGLAPAFSTAGAPFGRPTTMNDHAVLCPTDRLEERTDGVLSVNVAALEEHSSNARVGGVVEVPSDVRRVVGYRDEIQFVNGFADCPAVIDEQQEELLLTRVFGVPAQRGVAISPTESSQRTVGRWSPYDTERASSSVMVCVRILGEHLPRAARALARGRPRALGERDRCRCGLARARSAVARGAVGPAHRRAHARGLRPALRSLSAHHERREDCREREQRGRSIAARARTLMNRAPHAAARDEARRRCARVLRGGVHRAGVHRSRVDGGDGRDVDRSGVTVAHHRAVERLADGRRRNVRQPTIGVRPRSLCVACARGELQVRGERGVREVRGHARDPNGGAQASEGDLCVGGREGTTTIQIPRDPGLRGARARTPAARRFVRGAANAIRAPRLGRFSEPRPPARERVLASNHRGEVCSRRGWPGLCAVVEGEFVVAHDRVGKVHRFDARVGEDQELQADLVADSCGDHSKREGRRISAHRDSNRAHSARACARSKTDRDEVHSLRDVRVEDRLDRRRNHVAVRDEPRSQRHRVLPADHRHLIGPDDLGAIDRHRCICV